ncbi:hypothetical protein G3578_13960 [Brevibacillus sp. SYP-B805]|uniref:hypothetical protein n=1 Tax=Brevibacillus sp. SYP-B805 TaxID=1578199 RepID=UPI0013E9F32B|nr:hypothetical protein [Brevibacillus sp. SYP-B805]NGQ96266.1 hypothetical protein [Brevibacillus sp. SYP-B805]
MAKVKRKIKTSTTEQPQMKIVMHTTCEVCTQQCARGLSYLEQMKKPGAIGFGVPCILTLGKP